MFRAVPCIAKTIAMYAPLLFLVEYSDIMIAVTGYIAPMPVPRKKRQKANDPITAGPLAPNENAEKNAKSMSM